MEFTKTAIPTASRSGRVAMDNPFVEQFPADEEALTFTVEDGRESLAARRTVRQIRQAAAAVERTGRIVMKDLPSGEVEFTVWTVDKIKRRSKSKV